MKKLIIGICTYNRKDIIDLTAKSLSEIIKNDNYIIEVRVYDDNSNEFDKNYLKKIYPSAIITINKNNFGADFNTQLMYKDFLNSDADYLLNADSDLLFDPNIISIIDDNIKILKNIKQPLMFSVFNAQNHKIIKKYNANLCIKKTVGAAGVLFSKEAIQLFIDNIPKKYSFETPGIDHYFCKVFTKNKYKIFCTNNSYVQHIGFSGQNSFISNPDWGQNFNINSITNSKAIIYIFEKYFINNLTLENFIYDCCKNGKFGLRFIVKCFYLYICFKIKKINWK